VIGLAAADMLVRGGERAGLLGLTNPIASRAVIERLADALMLQGDAPDEMPPAAPVPSRSEAILVSDFIHPLDELKSRFRLMAERRARGHLVVIADPAEETFPFTGHNEFFGSEPGPSLRVGDSTGFAAAYRQRIAEHRDGLRAITRELGWSFNLHRTDRPASELLLSLRMMLESGQSTPMATGA